MLVLNGQSHYKRHPLKKHRDEWRIKESPYYQSMAYYIQEKQAKISKVGKAGVRGHCILPGALKWLESVLLYVDILY